MKCVSFILTILIYISTFTSCQDGNKNKLRTQIHLADIDCPLNMGIIGDLVSIKYNEKDNIVLMYYSINEEYAGPIFLKNSKENLLKQFRLGLSNEESKQIIADIVNAHASLTAVYKSNSTGKTRTLSLSYDELKEIKDTPLSQREIDLMRVTTMIENQNSICPIKEDEGMVRTKVELVDNNIVTYYEMDENLYDMQAWKKSKNELWELMYQNIKSMCEDPVLSRDYKLAISLDMGFHYRYYGKKTKDFVDIIFTPDDLRLALSD